MKFTTVLLVIILSLIMGLGIFLADQIINKRNSELIKAAVSITDLTKKAPTPSPSPTPKPTLPPLTESSDLKQELQKTIPSDFQSEFNNLKKEVSGN